MTDTDIPINDTIHIRLGKSPKGKKLITELDNGNNLNFSNEIFLKKLCSDLKKEIGCGGSVIFQNNKPFLILQGDQRESIKNYLIKKNYITEDLIQLHGG